MEVVMAIHQWPDGERPREKLLRFGGEALSDAELLAIFLRTGVAGKSAVDLARDLIVEHGSLRALLEADVERFTSSRGLGEAKYCQLQATLEMAKRYLNSALRRDSAFENPQMVRDYLSHHLRALEREQFRVLFLDNRHRLIRDETLFQGTIDQAVIHPREIVKQALAYNAAAVILAHNHPSGIGEPSRADIEMTHKIAQALELVEIRLLDHLIVGDEVVSIAERGVI